MKRHALKPLFLFIFAIALSLFAINAEAWRYYRVYSYGPSCYYGCHRYYYSYGPYYHRYGYSYGRYYRCVWVPGYYGPYGGWHPGYRVCN